VSAGLAKPLSGLLPGEEPASDAEAWLFRRHAAQPDVIVRAIRVRGPLDLAAVARAFSETARRHEALRTTFREVDGCVLARVEPPAPVPLEVEDARGASEESVAARLAEVAARPFDLARVPLMRLHVLVRGPEDHRVLLAIHHIGCDAWSSYMIMTEVAFFYPACRAGLDPELPPPARQYRDHARALAARLAERGEGLAAWWAATLAGAPRGGSRRDGESGACGGIPLRIEAPLAEALRAAAWEAGTTLFVALASALAGALGERERAEEVVIGTTTACRRHRDDAAAIGAYFNTLPLRLPAARALGAAERLRASARAIREALRREELPFARIEAAAGGGPLFRTLLVLHGAGLAPVPGLPAFSAGVPGGTLPFGDAVLEPVPLRSRRLGYDLYVVLAEVGDEVLGTLWHRHDAYDETAARSLASGLEAGLRALANGVDDEPR
jgi:hypothetical protein